MQLERTPEKERDKPYGDSGSTIRGLYVKAYSTRKNLVNAEDWIRTIIGDPI
jgi:hypothetical protein